MNCTCYREFSGGKHSPLCTLKQENRALRAEVTDLVAMRDADAYLIGRLRAEVEGLREQYAEAIDDLRAVNAHRAVIEKHEAALRGGEAGE